MLLALGVSTGASSAFADDPVTVDLSTTATNYTSNDPAPTLRATVDPILGFAQTVAAYDQNGQLRCQGDRYTASCWSVSAPAPENGTSTYTAYVIDGAAPTSGPPTSPAASSGPITIHNLGYLNTSLTLTSSVVTVTTEDPMPTLTAAADPGMSGSYVMSVYDNTGQLKCQAGTYSTGCHATGNVPLNGSRTYTAYVAPYDQPQTGAPVHDICATSAPITIVNIGWMGSLSFTASAPRTSTDSAFDSP
jgi:hypothetical protein